jgi:hypothetical protein
MSAHTSGETRRAVPTEYKGVTYRSKSEAMFAVWLEMSCNRDGHPYGIIYEPGYFKTDDGWIPDFLTWQVVHLDNKPEIRNVIYEYKPAKPTKTYIELFIKRSKQIHERFGGDYNLGVILMYGSVYGQDRGYIFGDCGLPQKPQLRLCNWLGEFEQAIRSVRFNLEHQQCRE